MKMAAVGLTSTSCPFATDAIAAKVQGSELGDHEAMAYAKVKGTIIQCKLCPRGCVVPDGRRGYCGVRENQGGTYKSLVYGRVGAAHVDPIEKKPLFHFLPGNTAFSIATAGCNVECLFCQNWRLSQSKPEQLQTTRMPPEKVAAEAVSQNCDIIAYTYNEPTIFCEFMLDCAREGKKKNLRSVMISNGYMNLEPMKTLCKELGGIKIDLKSFSDEFYKKYVDGELKPVLKTIELIKKLGMHLELVILLIPGLNDSDEEIGKMARWVVKNLGKDVPMHFSRFHPCYKMKNISRTPIKTVERAQSIALDEGVHYSYVGNAPGHKYENTFCHSCGAKIITRYGFHIGEVHIKDGKCEFCGAEIPGVWD